MVVNCVVKENILIEASIDTSTDVNCISQKHIGELGITYPSESNSIVTPDSVGIFCLGHSIVGELYPLNRQEGYV